MAQVMFEGDIIDIPVKANAVIQPRDMVATDSSGFAVPAATGTPNATNIVWGSAERGVDNTGGANAATTVPVRLSSAGKHFAYANAGSAVGQANVGALCYVAGPQSVNLTNTNAPAGVIVGFTPDGRVRVKHAI